MVSTSPSILLSLTRREGCLTNIYISTVSTTWLTRNIQNCTISLAVGSVAPPATTNLMIRIETDISSLMTFLMTRRTSWVALIILLWKFVTKLSVKDVNFIVPLRSAAFLLTILHRLTLMAFVDEPIVKTSPRSCLQTFLFRTNFLRPQNDAGHASRPTLTLPAFFIANQRLWEGNEHSGWSGSECIHPFHSSAERSLQSGQNFVYLQFVKNENTYISQPFS